MECPFFAAESRSKSLTSSSRLRIVSVAITA
jgi:hypothetical protein